MSAHTLDFFRKHVESITLGQARWRETVAVPDAWWVEYRRSHDAPSKLRESVVHIFDVTRDEDDIRLADLHWMGTTGVAYVWSYQRDGSRYYTAAFADRWTGTGAEEAVRKRAQEGRP